MKNKYYITNKRLNDTRFLKTEQKIINAFIKHPDANVNHLTRYAGISRSTFYRHHQKISTIITDYQKYLKTKLNHQLKRASRRNNNITLKRAYREALFFILNEKWAFQILAVKNETWLFDLVLDKLKPKIETSVRLPLGTYKLYRVYTGEIMIILSEWYKRGLSKNETDEVLEDIMLLSRSARARLMPLSR